MKQKQNNQTETSIRALQKAILDLHGCNSTWIESVQVEEVFEGQTVWEGVVQVFDLIDHPTAKPMHGPANWRVQKEEILCGTSTGAC
jgi:predicted nucleotidyltransferase